MRRPPPSAPFAVTPWFGSTIRTPAASSSSGPTATHRPRSVPTLPPATIPGRQAASQSIFQSSGELWHAAPVFKRHPVDDPLDEDDLQVDVAGHVRHKFRNEVAHRRADPAHRYPFCTRTPAHFLVRNVTDVDRLVDHRADDGRVVRHALAGVARRPERLIDAVPDPPL